MSSNLQLALDHLRAGDIVCVPTESSYGLAVDASDALAIERLHVLKSRGEASPFALIAGSVELARRCTGPWPDAAEELARQYWPGPLTLLLPPAEGTAPILVGPTNCIGVRVSSHALVTQLSTALQKPITATSANPAGQSPAQSLASAQRYFGAAVDFYLDGGRCAGQSSTLVSFADGGRPQVLRQGAIVLPPQA